jgi:hypothetical protein
MNLLDYVTKFPPVFERKAVLNTLSQLEEEYSTTLGSLLDDVEPVIVGNVGKSNMAARYRAALQRRVNTQGDPMVYLFASLRNLPSNFQVIEAEIKRLFAFQFTNTSLTVNRANVLRYVDALSFYIQYARKLLLIIVAEECQSLGRAAPLNWAPAEMQNFELGMPQFVELYLAMSLPADKLKQRLAQATDAEINIDTFDLATRTLGDARMDPLQMAGFSPQRNPLMLLGKYMAEMRVVKYDAAEDECRALKHRMMELQSQLAGNPTSPVLQTAIKKYEKRVSDYEFKMERIAKLAIVED